MKTKTLSTFYSNDLRKQVDIVIINSGGDMFALDYYYDKAYTHSIVLETTTVKAAEEAAQEYVSDSSL